MTRVLLISDSERVQRVFQGLEQDGLFQLHTVGALTQDGLEPQHSSPACIFAQSRISGFSTELALRKLKKALPSAAKVVLLAVDDEDELKLRKQRKAVLGLSTDDRLLAEGVREMLAGKRPAAKKGRKDGSAPPIGRKGAAKDNELPLSLKEPPAEELVPRPVPEAVSDPPSPQEILSAERALQQALEQVAQQAPERVPAQEPEQALEPVPQQVPEPSHFSASMAGQAFRPAAQWVGRAEEPPRDAAHEGAAPPASVSVSSTPAFFIDLQQQGEERELADSQGVETAPSAGPVTPAADDPAMEATAASFAEIMMRAAAAQDLSSAEDAPLSAPRQEEREMPSAPEAESDQAAAFVSAKVRRRETRPYWMLVLAVAPLLIPLLYYGAPLSDSNSSATTAAKLSRSERQSAPAAGSGQSGARAAAPAESSAGPGAKAATASATLPVGKAGLKALPPFMAGAEPDPSYGKEHPGWQRYIGQKAEYKLFKEGNVFRAMQVIGSGGQSISEEIYRKTLQEFGGITGYHLQSSARKGSYLVEHAVAKDGIRLMIYRKRADLSMKGLVIYHP